MMTKIACNVHVGFKISAPADAVWPYVNWTGPEIFGPGTFYNKVEIIGREPRPGSVRTFFPADGSSPISETLLYFDEGYRYYGYRVIDAGDLPVCDYEGRFSLLAAGAGACTIGFSTSAIPVGISDDDFRQLYVSLERQVAQGVASAVNAEVIAETIF